MRAAAALATLLALGAVPAAGAADPATCFDFARPVSALLRPPPAAAAGGADVHEFARRADGTDWAAGRALIAAPIARVYARILEHESLKDMSKTTLKRTSEPKPGYLAFQYVDVAVRVRALLVRMTIEWREAWGFVLTEGTEAEPRRIVASYQKVSGTGHIRHLCGQYVLSAVDAAHTDLAFYEEVRAARRDAEATRNMHMGILRNLRKP